MLPRPAEDYARRNNLYGVKTLSFEEIKKLIASRLSDKRFAHTMGVVESAVKLAERYGADVEKARMAALLHDCAKEYSEDKKRALCEIWDIPTDDILAKKISITHSLLGAESARRDFYITDNEILRAIRYHTTGFKDMTLMDKIIMLADFIEPTREYYDGLKEMRELAFTDLNAALRVGITETMRYNERKGLPVHPWGYDALASL